jgi:hypothetical protein
MTYEHCTECDAETGRAGKHDDSLYHASEGPFCVECYESWAENMICERNQLRADNQRLREALAPIKTALSQAVEYLDVSYFEKIHSRSVLHTRMQAALTTANGEVT